jgi:hypothetical protein
MELSLPNVTLVTIASRDIDETNLALLGAEQIDFGAVKMLCSALPMSKDNRVTYMPIPQIDYLGYQRFMIESLNAYVQTEHYCKRCPLCAESGHCQRICESTWRTKGFIAIQPPNS